jgi:hypothetical protein
VLISDFHCSALHYYKIYVPLDVGRALLPHVLDDFVLHAQHAVREPARAQRLVHVLALQPHVGAQDRLAVAAKGVLFIERKKA